MYRLEWFYCRCIEVRILFRNGFQPIIWYLFTYINTYILRNLHLTFNSTYYVQSKVRWRFRKILKPSQNIWTLKYKTIRFNLCISSNQALLAHFSGWASFHNLALNWGQNRATAFTWENAFSCVKYCKSAPNSRQQIGIIPTLHSIAYIQA